MECTLEKIILMYSQSLGQNQFFLVKQTVPNTSSSIPNQPVYVHKYLHRKTTNTSHILFLTIFIIKVFKIKSAAILNIHIRLVRGLIARVKIAWASWLLSGDFRNDSVNISAQIVTLFLVS